MPSTKTNWLTGIGFLLVMIAVALLIFLSIKISFWHGLIAFVLLTILSIMLWVKAYNMETRRKEEQEEFLMSFQPDNVKKEFAQAYTSYDLLSRIAIDDVKRKIYMWAPKRKNGNIITEPYYRMPYTIYEYDFEDLYDVKMTEYGRNQLKFVEGSKTAEDNKVETMELLLQFSDTIYPFHLLRFYHRPHNALNTNSAEYDRYKREFEYWYSILQMIINDQPITEQEHRLVEIKNYDADENSPFDSNACKESEEFSRSENFKIYSEREKHPEFEIEEEYKLSFNEQDIGSDLQLNDNQSSEDHKIDSERRPQSYFEKIVEQNRKAMGNQSDSND